MANEQVSRLYSGIADNRMFTEAQTIHNLLATDLADFAAKDAEFDAAFLATFQTEIDNSIGTKTDETVVDEIEELTQDMQEAWEACKNYFQDMKYYIEKAYPNEPGIYHQFGYDDYRNMSRLQDDVSPFMDNLEKRAGERQAALVAAGMPPAQLAQIANLKAAFKAADMAQNDAQKNRLQLTRDRIEQYNKVWKILQQINKLSKAVYRGDYAKLQQYLLPAPGTNAPESLSLTGTVLNASTSEPIEGALVELPELSLTATTDENGKYGFTQEIPAGETTLRISAPGFVTTEIPIAIVDGELRVQDVSLAGV